MNTKRKTKRMAAVLLVLIMTVVLMTALALPAAAATNGTCGENLTWTLDDSGTLIISGTGEMTDNTFGGGPWDEKKIKNAIIENGVTTIGELAFASCGDLTTIKIPESVTTIGELAFYGCDNLTAITVNSKNSRYSSQEGVLFNKNKTILIQYPQGKTDSTYIIPNGVTSIGVNSFSYCSKLTAITIGNSVKTIRESAFYDCDSLIAVTIGNSVTTVERESFYDCDRLNTVTIGNSVKTLGMKSFYGCDSLTAVTIGNGVTTIGYGAFCNCDRLTTIKIPDSVILIDEDAFYHCDSLIDITVDRNNSQYASECGVLFNKNKTTLIQYPKGRTEMTYTIPNSVLTIGMWAFGDCDSLTDINLGENVEKIGHSAFTGCDGLTTVATGNGVKQIGGYAFAKCKRLTTVTIGKSVETIGAKSFYNCNSLTAVTIGNNVTTIGNNAFAGCASLSTIKIPDSVTVIEYEAFYDCNSLTVVTLGSGVTKIEDSAFYWCDSLTDIYYRGIMRNWENIAIEGGNDALLSATIHLRSKLIEYDAINDVFVVYSDEVIPGAKLLIAAYDGKKVKNMHISLLDIAEKETRIPNPLTDFDNADIVKVMLWSGVGVTPLMEMLEITP